MIVPASTQEVSLPSWGLELGVIPCASGGKSVRVTPQAVREYLASGGNLVRVTPQAVRECIASGGKSVLKSSEAQR
jgi:hypothetical protein